MRELPFNSLSASSVATPAHSEYVNISLPLMGSSKTSLFDSALGGSSQAEFIFRPAKHFRGARAANPREFW